MQLARELTQPVCDILFIDLYPYEVQSHSQ